MNKSKLLILTLALLMLFNFIIQPQVKVHAVGGTIATIYGVELGTKLIAFLYASLAVGVTYTTLEQAKNVMENIDFSGVNWDDMINRAPEPPEGGGSNPNKKLILSALIGVPTGAFISSIFGDLKDWFQSIGAKEGENIIGPENNNIITEERVITTTPIEKRYVFPNGYITDGEKYNFGYYINGIGATCEVTRNGSNSNGVTNLIIKYSNGYIEEGVYPYRPNEIKISINKEYNGDILIRVTPRNRDSVVVPNISQEPPNIDKMEYNIQKNSPILTNTPPTTIPQPSLDKIPSLQQQEDGTLIFPGTEEELSNELVNNLTWEDFQNMKYEGYSLTETEQGIVITPDNNTEPTPGRIELPFPDDPGVPFPEGSQSDLPENELIGQANIMDLLKSIINWLYNIWKQPQQLIQMLLVPEPDYLKKKIDTIKTKIETKVPMPDLGAFDFFAGITPIPIPDGYIDDHKAFDASYINNLADTLKTWQRWFWYLTMALYSFNQIYKLIRGTDYIHSNNYDGGGKN